MSTSDAPASDLDPFSIAFFDDPFPEHDRLREAGPVVRLRHIGCWGVARWQEVTETVAFPSGGLPPELDGFSL